MFLTHFFTIKYPEYEYECHHQFSIWKPDMYWYLYPVGRYTVGTKGSKVGRGTVKYLGKVGTYGNTIVALTVKWQLQKQ